MRSFIQDFKIYVGRMKEFTLEDWWVYTLWIGLMTGLFVTVAAFLIFGFLNQVSYPGYVWTIPIGIFIFVIAIAIDTIGHRTIYRLDLKGGEDLVHHVTIFAGITSTLFLCLGYHWPEFFRFPALDMLLLSAIFSLIDEAMHWRRYFSKRSDRIEMWSHFFIFVGHFLMILAWWHWFDQGYPGVEETLSALYR